MAGKTSKKSTKVSMEAVPENVGGEVVLLSGGNPQIAKADGDTPVQAYIAAMPGWKAVRWNSPFYGLEGEGWFASYHVFTRYVKVTFFQGAPLQPVPPGAGKDKDSRWVDIHEGGLDEAEMVAWVWQAAVLPGWNGF